MNSVRRIPRRWADIYGTRNSKTVWKEAIRSAVGRYNTTSLPVMKQGIVLYAQHASRIAAATAATAFRSLQFSHRCLYRDAAVYPLELRARVPLRPIQGPDIIIS